MGFSAGNGLKVVVECSQGQSTPNEVTAQKAIPEIMADVIDDDSNSLGSLIKSEDFSDDAETKACEQILDNLSSLPSLIQHGKRPSMTFSLIWENVHFEEE